MWFWHAGAPMVLTLSANGHDAEAHHLGPELKTGQRPQLLVPANCWQTATSLGAWTLVSCTVAPGFDFAGFEMAPGAGGRRRADERASNRRRGPRDLVAACERRIVNAWPAPTTLIIGDWVVRMANGYSGRANSASPLSAGADLSDASST